MESLIAFIQLLMSGALGAQAQRKWEDYQTSVDQQIAEGRIDYDQAVQQTMDRLATDPNLADARKILEDRYSNLSRTFKDDYSSLRREAGQSRAGFLRRYDLGTTRYLMDERHGTADLLRDLERQSGQLRGQYDSRTADLAARYAQREADVMGLLEGQGEQALKDTQRTFGEQTAASLGDLAARGLSGSGVASSIRGGMATRESDQLARIREAVAAQKAGALGSLRGEGLASAERTTGEGLGFGARAMELGAGFRESGINRRLQAAANVQQARAAYDAAMRGESLGMGERGITGASELDYQTGGSLADYLYGLGTYGTDLYSNLNNQRLGWLYGGPIQYMPPDTSWLPAFSYGTGSGLRSAF